MELGQAGDSMYQAKTNGESLYCEKCSAELSAETASRTILYDGQLHVFCDTCMKRMLIVKDGSLQL